MFKCQLTGKISESGQAAVKLVTKRRKKLYTLEPKVDKYTKDNENQEPIIVEGWEIVEELLVLPEVAEKYNNGQEQTEEQIGTRVSTGQTEGTRENQSQFKTRKQRSI